MKKLTSFVLIMIISVIGLAILKPASTGAVFNANLLMDDYIFERADSMNEGQIQSFLNAFPSSCLKSYSTPEPQGWSSSQNAYVYGGNVSAARAIARAAQIYGINPQVILATLQKEQSLVTGDAGCSDRRYEVAMGYDCPDSGACPTRESSRGFSAQIIKASWMLRFSQQRSYGNTSWGDPGDQNITYGGYMTAGVRARVHGGSTATYDGWATIDNQAVYISNGATAALYRYTPHFHGNQNFVTIFERWFGPTVGEGFTRVISDNGDPRQWALYGGVRHWIPDSQTLFAWNLDAAPLVTMPAAQLERSPIGQTLGRLMVLNTGPQTLYFLDNGKRYKVPWQELFNSWNLQNERVTSVTPGLFVQSAPGGDLAFSIKDPNSSTTYLVDGAQNGQTVIRPYQNSAIHAAWEGSSQYYTEVSADYFDSINNAVGSTITTTRVSVGGLKYEIAGGRKFNLLSALAPLYPSTETTISNESITRFPPGHLGNITQIVKQLPNGPHYLIDNGKKHRILSANALTAWSVPRQDISPVAQEFLNVIPDGPDIGWFMAEAGGQLYYIDHYKTAVASELDGAYRNAVPVFQASTSLMALYPNAAGLTGFLKGPSATEVYMVDGSGKRHPMRWLNKLDAWVGQISQVTTVPDYIVDSIPLLSHPGTFVSDGSTNYVLDGGKKWSVSAQVKTDWGLGTPETYSDGTLDRIPLGGVLPTKFRTAGGAYVMARGGVAYSTGSQAVAQAWALESTPVMSNAIVPNNIPNAMLDRFVRSSAGGDDRQFVINGGNWYTINETQLRNLGGSPPPVVSMDPAWAPNTITAWP